MDVVFKKRRYYRGEFREIGTRMNMDPRTARAYLRGSVVVLAITEPNGLKKDPPKTVEVKSEDPGEEKKAPSRRTKRTRRTRESAGSSAGAAAAESE